MGTRRWLDEREQEAWRHLVAVLLRLPSVIEQQLQRDAGLAHIEYLILALLSEADGRRLRLSHLAGQASVSLSRLSHVVTRMERRGWVVREPDPDDARATRAVLTDAGHAEVVAAAPGHVEVVRTLVFEPLSEEQVEALGTLCRSVLARLAPHGGPVGGARAGGEARSGADPPDPARPLVEGETRDTPRPPPPRSRPEVEIEVEEGGQLRLEVGDEGASGR